MNDRDWRSRGAGVEPRQIDPQGLSLPAILPGLLFALGVGLLSVCGWHPVASPWGLALSLVMATLPWATVLVLRHPISALGYTGRRALARYGWGMVTGAAWRGLSMLLNLHWAAGWPLASTAGPLLQGFVVIPLVEETFFRGYLGLGLRPRLGWAGAVVVQAVLFTLLPGHWGQGVPGVIGVLVFGLLSGALVAKTGSVWAAWGAHGLANVLPGLLLLLVA